MARNPIDMTGERYGRLLCLTPLGSTKSGMVWECLCDCGNKTKVVRGNLLTGAVKSCGCLWNESRIANGLAVKVHGRTSKDINGVKSKRRGSYSTWEAMHQRCKNPKSDWYHRYGGRGIKICESWYNFENFLMDMGERPDGMTLDRINPDGDYEPSNCRWVTILEQNRNKSKL